MTLEQAHAIQRKELISLRAKVARLEKQLSGLFSVEEKESLERRIRHLEQVIKTENNRHQSAREHWKLTDKRCNDLEFSTYTICISLHKTNYFRFCLVYRTVLIYNCFTDWRFAYE